jgi:hypothetical protein
MRVVMVVGREVQETRQGMKSLKPRFVVCYQVSKNSGGISAIFVWSLAEDTLVAEDFGNVLRYHPAATYFGTPHRNITMEMIRDLDSRDTSQICGGRQNLGLAGFS